jgi:hypothetical protein
MLIPLKPNVSSQKAPNGLQHPGGDAIQIAGTFLGAGGKQVFIYMQDIYSKFPYENLGLSDYLPKVDAQVSAVLATPYPRAFVYVPFNEPDNIWYNKTDKKAQYFNDWKTVFQEIRKNDTAARIAGPNIANFDAGFISDFLAFCKANSCVPDVMTWHELNVGFYSGWSQHYSSYRSLEANNGIGPLPININEYSTFKDLSVPGELIQWIARFEASKVGAGLAYWHIDDDLDDLVVENNKPNSGWWLYKWYGDMTGSTVQVTSPSPNGYGLQGIAAIDAARHQSSVIFGGGTGDVSVSVKGLSALGNFGNRVRATVWVTRWSGYEGVADPPAILSEGDYFVKGGQISVPINDMDPQFGYRLVVAPATGPTIKPIQDTNTQRYEAEDADISDGVIYAAGSLANPYVNAASNQEVVGSLDFPDSKVTFNVTVLKTGKYQLDIYYGNGSQAISQQFLQIDGGTTITVNYTPDVDWTFICKKTVYVDLTAGSHTISLAKNPSSGSALLDCIDLTYLAPATNVLPEKARRYEAEDASLDSSFRVERDAPNFSGTGFAESNNSEQPASITFIVEAMQDGFYNVRLRYAVEGRDSQSAQLLVNGSALNAVTLENNHGSSAWNDTAQDLFLAAGINRLTFQISGSEGGRPVKMDCLDVTPLNGDTGKVANYEAESPQNTLAGTAVVTQDPYASGGAYVGFIGNGAANALQFNGVQAPVAGSSKVVVRYANNDRGGASGGSYNTNVIDRRADISVNGGQPMAFYFHNTYGWDSYRSVVLDLPLVSGGNTIRFSNPIAYAPNIDSIKVAPPAIGTQSYEAESAINLLKGSVTILEVPTASGGKVVGRIGNGPANTLTFRGINISQSGSYKLVIYFAAEEDLTADIAANEGSVQSISFPSSGGADAVNTQIVDVQMNAGENAITFSNDRGLAPAIDKIEILQP